MLLDILHHLRAHRMVLASASPRRLELLKQVGLVPTVVPSTFAEDLAKDCPPAQYAARTAEMKCIDVCDKLLKASAEPALVLSADSVVVCDGDVLEKPRSPAEAAAMMTRLSGRTHSVASGVTVAVLRPVLDCPPAAGASASISCTWALEGVEVVETRERRTVTAPAAVSAASSTAASAVPSAVLAAAAAAPPAPPATVVDITRYRFVNETEVEFGTLPPAVIAAYVGTPDPYDKAGGYGVQALAAQFVRAVRGDYYTVVGLPVFLVAALLRHIVATHPMFSAGEGGSAAATLSSSLAAPRGGDGTVAAADSSAAGPAARLGSVPGAS